MGELRGLSRWRSCYLGIGLDETLVDNAVEKAGMLLVQVERFIRVLSSVVQQFANFFSWLLKCIKQLMSEPSDQLLTYNSFWIYPRLMKKWTLISYVANDRVNKMFYIIVSEKL
ncbi:anaphase-promoting complex subunit 4-like [Eucalyptus grandis]|uniref:anaphase-promoting complex subunit 4-like n=1 Tax=Eucalyptus grandis TaxID=71139 RepID=UPI00192E977F|nr:anaphase-promoting complex subunit 4-like [Eucalyptus grandis]